MSETRPNPFWRFIVGVGKVVNFINHLVFNVFMLLFLLLLFGILAIGMAARSGAEGGGLRPVLDKTALVIDLEGTLVEQYTSEPIARAIAQATGGRDAGREIQLRDVVKALDTAKDDPKIGRVVLLTDGFRVAGFAAMRELGAALRDFRAGGKQVIAYGAGMEQKGYYLAAQADEVYLDPDGAILLEGLGRYRLYYRQALQDKLGVDVHLFRVGEYKSAAEPYILDAASPESREADLFWMNDLWQRYLTDVAAARKLPVAELTAMVNDLPALEGPFTTKLTGLASKRLVTPRYTNLAARSSPTTPIRRRSAMNRPRMSGSCASSAAWPSSSARRCPPCRGRRKSSWPCRRSIPTCTRRRPWARASWPCRRDRTSRFHSRAC